MFSPERSVVTAAYHDEDSSTLTRSRLVIYVDLHVNAAQRYAV
jgi:hypothetical protein